jgi:Family of unknown function (DUF5677)
MQPATREQVPNMSKNSKKRRDGKSADRMRTTLGQHQRQKSKLIPPLNRMPAPVSRLNWMHDRVPEMLWACLVRAMLPRGEALQAFREIALIAKEFKESSAPPDTLLPTHTNLAAQHPQLIPRIVQIIVKRPLGYAALRPLAAIQSLPGLDHWLAAVGVEPDPNEFNALADAMVEFFDHQSEHSTDVRWLLILFAGLAGRLQFPATMEERTRELLDFPHRGDMRSVRPFIRSSEPAVWMLTDGSMPKFQWSAQFWHECHERTPCLYGSADPVAAPLPPPADFLPVVTTAIAALAEHWLVTSPTTAVDATHEGTFAFVLYALACLLELLGANRTRITGRLLLRTLTECRITLAYLQKKNDPELWAKFRRYGAGQAKLVFLKLSEAKKPPHSISLETLEQLANEDMWEEFVDIDLGHWAGADLRKMAEESGTKNIYDSHYGWTSGFAHGHWSAMRDATLAVCLNPLHRAHRIPILNKPVQGDTLLDAVELVEAMIADLLKSYPGAELTLRPKDAAPANPQTEGPAA